ncbi:AT-rich interactive domain-containing protein 1 isoform X2 [Ricinus communis]|nr:AT-rich interactive domain-containing protein 1 isoform X2 [Ricinus communis]XP_048234142.1 AT-rich interactive domain-containing protein 1 isoform X2 [Ricinus communis]
MIAGDNCSRTPKKKLELTKDLKTEIDCVDDRSHFDNCLNFFRQEICAIDVAFPPMLGNGQSVDLFKLYMIVRKKGGYDAVSQNELWDVVADESGFGVKSGSSVKLVYAKYLDALEKWLEKAVGDKNSKTKSSNGASNAVGVSVDLGFEFKGSSDWKSVLNVCAELDSPNGSEKCTVDDEESSVHIGTGRSAADFVEVGHSNYSMAKSSVIDSFSDEDKNCDDVQEKLDSNLTSVKASDEDEEKSVVVEMDGSKECDHGDDNDAMMLDSDAVKESASSRKRKRESLCKMLKWITGIARNPCDDVVASLPEWSKWDSYGNEELWKLVLLARESLFLKRNVDASAEQSSGQKYRKMHPCMYDDHVGSVYNFRERLRCSKGLPSGITLSQAQAYSKLPSSTTENDSNSSTKGCSSDYPSTEYSLLDLPVEKTIPLGPDFQAEIPEWTGVVCESDSKWLGARVWPPEKMDNRFVVEREPIGKGRQDSCGCEVPKSVECVRFHTTERRMKMKREVGVAFYHWRFDKMGEDVKLSWTKEEEKKFEAIVRSNPPSLDKCFWDEIFKFFSTKRREDLVSYYFNVFLMQRRAHQNRFTPNNIDSDDDESECGVAPNSSGREAPKSPGSLLYSAKKSHKSGK